MRFSYFGSGKFSAVDLVFYYYLAGVFDIDKTHLELTIAGFHCHAIKIKIENYSMNEVKKFTRYRR